MAGVAGTGRVNRHPVPADGPVLSTSRSICSSGRFGRVPAVRVVAAVPAGPAVRVVAAVPAGPVSPADDPDCSLESPWLAHTKSTCFQLESFMAWTQIPCDSKPSSATVHTVRRYACVFTERVSGKSLGGPQPESARCHTARVRSVGRGAGRVGLRSRAGFHVRSRT